MKSSVLSGPKGSCEAPRPPESAIGVFSQLQQVYGLVNDSVALNFSSAAGADPVALLQAPAFVVPRVRVAKRRIKAPTIHPSTHS